MTVIQVGWGEESWGEGPWGSSGATILGSLFMLAADAVSERQVHVLLSAPPLANSPIAVGDALNPLTWQVTRLDTGEDLVVLAARPIGSTIVELYLLHKLASGLIRHRVRSTTLEDPNGSPIVPPTSVDFPGCLKDVPALVPQGISDIANTPISPDQFGGILTIDSSGDYAHDTGEAFLGKLILRRLTTSPNEYFYMANYGLGIQQKQPLKISDIPKLQAAAQQQLLQEPEFLNTRVQIVLTSENILYLQVQATLRQNNQQVSTRVPLPSSLVSL